MVNDDTRPTVVPESWGEPMGRVPRLSALRQALPLVVWAGCLAVAMLLLLALGDGRLAVPPVTDPGMWRVWAQARDPLEVTMAVLRVLALGGAWYLAGVTFVSVVARLLRVARLVRVADALSVGPVRVLVQQAIGMGLAAGVLTVAVPAPVTAPRAAVASRSDDVAVMIAVDGEVVSGGTASSQEGSPVLLLSDPDQPPHREAVAPVPGPRRAASAPATTEPPPRGADSLELAEDVHAGPGSEPPGQGTWAGPTQREVQVRPGDHFWALAERAVADHLGRPGTEAEVAKHWDVLVRANEERLVAPGNPDLLVPGQQVIVPPVAKVPS